jgi:threonyl-tRNA synthetase
MAAKKPSEYDKLDTMRHSAAHLLAAAVTELYPDVKLGVGPVIESGFYYDMLLPKPLTHDDLESIEAKMLEIRKRGAEFVRKEMPIEEAIEFFKERGQDFKVDLLRDLMAHGTTNLKDEEAQDMTDPSASLRAGSQIASVYWTGEFVDLCRGPHVANTKEIGVIKLHNIAGAYWRGKSENPMLQRVYGYAFETKEDLKAHLKMLEEAEKRDHRKLGKELKIFALDEMVGPGMPLWLPNGAVLAEELENLAKETEFQGGYLRVRTPHVAKEEMYVTSGHLPYYKDGMFPPMIEEENGKKTVFYLKAMNCPHHHRIYATEPRSYRDLPLRLAEYGTVYRYEQSGELMGLMRVRAMQMNDAHIYCATEQFAEEFRAVNEMYLKYFKLFGLGKYMMRFSTHDPKELGKKYINEPELWKKTEDMVRKVLVESGINFVEVANEAAFYGPKIDVQVWSSIGREFTLATNQVDFAVPERFGLTYKDSDGKDKTPLAIHRAPLGTHERFIGFLIEHYAGAFPTWLSPQQVAILPVAERHNAACLALKKRLMALGVRAHLDDTNESVGKKIRAAEKMKVPYQLVMGDKEISTTDWTGSETLSIRKRGSQDTTNMTLAAFEESLIKEIKDRA